MRIKVPSKKVSERFFLIYELEGAQRAANVLTRHYQIRRMKVILDGRRVGSGSSAIYYKNKAYFTKNGLRKRYVLHELYHHIVEANGLEMTATKEESRANEFVRKIMKKAYPRAWKNTR